MIFTIGHSRHPISEFLAMIEGHGIQAIADVRRKPYSRRQPQYNREALAAALAEVGVEYSHHEGLGGMREPEPSSPHRGLPLAVRGFADYMETAAFRAALDELIRVSRRKRTAILCAEASPGDCHRRLISDALVTRGVGVEHVLDPDRRESHRLSPGLEVEGDRWLYRGKQAQLDLEGS